MTDRRSFLKSAGAVAAAALLPSAEELHAMNPETDHDHTPPAKAVPTFVAGEKTLLAQTLKVGPTQIEYFECGPPDGVPLVFVHGFPDSPLAWQGVVKELDLAKYRIVLPYLRGCGGSIVLEPDCVGGQFAALADDLLAFTSALKLERFHLAGHDWGARTSYAAAVLCPQRILTLTGLASPYFAWRGEPAPPAQIHGFWYQYFFQVEAARKMLTEHRQDFCRELWRTWCPGWRFTDAEFAEAATAWDNPQFVEIVLHYYRMRHGGALGRRAYAEAQEKLDAKPPPKITVPTLFIHGSADACELTEGVEGQETAFTGGYERVLVPDAGHFPHRENPSAVARVLRRQLQSRG